MKHFFQNFKYIFIFIFTVLTLVFGLYIRFDDIEIWEKNKNSFYIEDNRPILTSLDGYYFAKFSDYIINNEYKDIDKLANVPSYSELPSPAPLQSVMAGYISNLSNIPIENIAFWLTPILAVFVSIALILYFREFNLYITGVISALLTNIGLVYISRTSVARFDTDSLNLFFPFLSAFLFLKTVNSKNEKTRYIFAILSGVSLYLYYWWYLHSTLIAILIITFVFMLLLKDRFKLTKTSLISLILVLIFSNPLVSIPSVIHTLNIFSILDNYIFHVGEKVFSYGDLPFPNVAQSVSELKKFSLENLLKITLNNMFLFMLGIVGSLVLLIRNWKYSIPIIPIFLIGLLTFKSGNRFSMYLLPFLGAGIGYIVENILIVLKEKFKEKLDDIKLFIIYSLTTIFIAVGLIYINKHIFLYTAKPKINKLLVEDFIKFRSITPKDSWIWTWWDFGYPIQFYSKRGTYIDGGSFQGFKTYFVARTYSAFYPKEAHNIILALSNRNLYKNPINKEVMEDILQGKFSNPSNRNIYWLFTIDQIKKYPWISYFGNWDFNKQKGKHHFLHNLGICKIKKKYFLVCSKGKIIDIKNGLILFKLKNKLLGKRLKLFILKDNNTGKLLRYVYKKNSRGLYLEGIKVGNGIIYFLVNKPTFYSMFNQMYILRNYDKNYFELVYDHFPVSVLYKVKVK